MNLSVLKIQTRLKEMGYQPGPLDGIRGRLTIGAVKMFQYANGLVGDGLVGPKTLTALFPSAAQLPATMQDRTPWMDQVAQVMGLHEDRNKSRLMAWLMSDGAGVGDPSITPWCGDLAQTAFALSMPEEPMITNPYLAANWVKFGIECTPQFGAPLSFWRDYPSSWKGHMAFYLGETATHYRVRGGNQSNAVTDTFIAKERLRPHGCRWPATALPPTGRAVFVDRNGAPVSVNEA